MISWKIDLDEAGVNELQRLMDLCGIEDRLEFFNASLTHMKWMIERSRQQCRIFAVSENSDPEELTSPALDRAAKRSRLRIVSDDE